MGAASQPASSVGARLAGLLLLAGLCLCEAVSVCGCRLRHGGDDDAAAGRGGRVVVVRRGKGPICCVFSWDVEEIRKKRKFADLQPFMLI